MPVIRDFGANEYSVAIGTTVEEFKRQTFRGGKVPFTLVRVFAEEAAPKDVNDPKDDAVDDAVFSEGEEASDVVIVSSPGSYSKSGSDIVVPPMGAPRIRELTNDFVFGSPESSNAGDCCDDAPQVGADIGFGFDADENDDADSGVDYRVVVQYKEESNNFENVKDDLVRCREYAYQNIRSEEEFSKFVSSVQDGVETTKEILRASDHGSLMTDFPTSFLSLFDPHSPACIPILTDSPFAT